MKGIIPPCSGKFVPQATHPRLHNEDTDGSSFALTRLYHVFHYQVTSFENCEMCFLRVKRCESWHFYLWGDCTVLWFLYCLCMSSPRDSKQVFSKSKHSVWSHGGLQDSLTPTHMCSWGLIWIFSLPGSKSPNRQTSGCVCEAVSRLSWLRVEDHADCGWHGRLHLKCLICKNGRKQLLSLLPDCHVPCDQLHHAPANMSSSPQ